MNLQNYRLNFDSLNTQQALYLAEKLGIEATKGTEIFDIALTFGWDQATVVKKIITSADPIGVSVIETLTGIKRHTWRVSPKKTTEES